MNSIVKRGSEESKQDLVNALQKFCELLADQKEDAAIKDLNAYSEVVELNDINSEPFKIAIEGIIECFDGDHELIAYTLHKSKDSEVWTIAEELANSSTRVLNLANRFKSQIL